MQNTDAQGLFYTAGACPVSPAAGLQSTLTAVAAYRATLTIDLTTNGAARLAGRGVRPRLGACGGLPLS